MEKMYAAPVTEVLKMSPEGVIATSDVNGIRSGYGEANNDNWDLLVMR